MGPALASFISDFWNDQLVEHGRQWVFLVLLGFVGSFAFIRMSTRLMRSPRVPWWPGSVESGGVHLHHLVFGIVLMMAAGTISFAGFSTDVIYGICAVAFACVAICFLKHRMVHGLVGLFVPPLDVYGAIRLGKPDSPWARRFYGERNPKKQAKAERRFHPGRRTDRFKEAVRTAIGGSTESEYLAKIGREE
jgi:hypothetical protein